MQDEGFLPSQISQVRPGRGWLGPTSLLSHLSSEHRDCEPTWAVLGLGKEHPPGPEEGYGVQIRKVGQRRWAWVSGRLGLSPN